MKKIKLVIFFLSLSLCHIYSQGLNNVITGKLEGEIFNVVDTTDNYIVLEYSSDQPNKDKENKGLHFYFNVPKGVKLKKNIVSFNDLFLFENEDKEIIVLEIFKNKNGDKEASRGYRVEDLKSNISELRCYGFFIHDEYVAYYFNVKPENNYLFVHSIRSIREGIDAVNPFKW